MKSFKRKSGYFFFLVFLYAGFNENNARLLHDTKTETLFKLLN